MKNDPLYDRFLDLSWRRTLTPAEQQDLSAWLAAHPEARQEHSLELALTEALASLPDIPVASNFTVRVLNQVNREAATAAVQRQGGNRWFHFRWLPRVGFAAVIVIAGGLVYHREHLNLERKEYAQSIATVSDVSSLPSPEILQNFEAIRRLAPAPAPDEQLLTLLQ
jgi:hypothetical protein